jgi:hypothetical protein
LILVNKLYLTKVTEIIEIKDSSDSEYIFKEIYQFKWKKLFLQLF